MYNNTILKMLQSYFSQYNGKFKIYCSLFLPHNWLLPLGQKFFKQQLDYTKYSCPLSIKESDFWILGPFFHCTFSVLRGSWIRPSIFLQNALPQSSILKHSFLYYMEEDKNALNTLKIVVFANVRILTQSRSWISLIDFLCS